MTEDYTCPKGPPLLLTFYRLLSRCILAGHIASFIAYGPIFMDIEVALFSPQSQRMQVPPLLSLYMCYS
jgi:hypothetical protein